MKRESWAALTLGLVLAYGCAEAEPLGNVFIRDLNPDGGIAIPSAGGTGGDPQGQGGTGPAPGSGGTGGAGGTGAAPTTGGTGGTPGTGGTGGAPGTGGTGGAPGTGGTGTGAGGTAPVVAGNCVETGDISVFYSEAANAQTQNIRMTLAVRNDGAGFPVSDLVLRYWFGDDGLGGFVGQSFYAQLNAGGNITANVTTTFGSELGSAYVDIGFNANTDIGAGIQQLQMDIHSDPYANWDQTNDFSFVEDANNVVNENITAYVAGEQVFGCTPPAQ